MVDSIARQQVVQSPTDPAEHIARLEEELAALREALGMTTVADEKLVTLAEAAELTGRSYRTMERWVARGWLDKVDTVPSVHGSPSIRVSRKQVLAIESRQRPGPGPKSGQN